MKDLLLLIACVFFMFSCEIDDKAIRLNKQKSIKKIDSLFVKLNKEDLFHGGIVISEKGKVIYENYIGLADRGWNISFHNKVKFDIASLNKSMIAALVLKAVEEDELSLDDKLTDLLVRFKYEGNFHKNITLHNLLCHSSGIMDYGEIDEVLKQNNYQKFKRLHFTNESYINFISKLTCKKEPNKEFYYSNFGYHILAIILEETYNMSFSLLLKEKLTKPLGLGNTFSYSENQKVIKEVAKAYSFKREIKEWHKNPFIDLTIGRRVFSTVSDLNKWGNVMSTPGYLTKKSLELMKENHLKDISNTMSYGYGWVVFNKETKSKMGNLNIDIPYIIHGGTTDGYKSMLFNINEGAYVISFFSNVGNSTNEMKLAQQILSFLI